MKTLPDSPSRAQQLQTVSQTSRAILTPALTPGTISDSRLDLNEPDMPRVLGDYELESLIAPGGMGLVYKARHRTSGQSVALKTIRRDFLVTPDMMMRFRREVQAGELHHPNIMPVLDAGESDGRPFLIMPLARDSLSHLMDRYREPKSAARLIGLVARGVDAAHRKGVVHRDLKPANILLDDTDAPRVADFGLAKIIDDLDTLSLTVTGAVLGTPPYMAPEQAWGTKADIGPAVDVWALGVVLYELVTGQRPFDGPSREATLERIRRIDPPSPRQWKPDLDRQLETIILTCLEKDPKHRYATAGVLADDLEAWLSGQRIKAKRRRLAAWFRPIAANWKRWAPAAAGVAALLFSILGLASIIDLTSNQRSPVVTSENLTALQREVHAGNPVRLVGRSEPPKWYDWQLAKTGGAQLRQLSGVTIAETPNYDVLTLYKPAPKYFRIDAELRLREITPLVGSGFGIAFGHRRHYLNESTHDGLFSFSELGSKERGDGPRIQLDFGVHTSAAKPRWLSVLRDRMTPDVTTGIPVKYSLEVNSKSITGVRGNEPPLEIAWNAVNEDVKFAVGKMGMPQEFADVDSSGALGIVVNRCAVEVLSFVLTPLTAKE